MILMGGTPHAIISSTTETCVKLIFYIVSEFVRFLAISSYLDLLHNQNTCDYYRWYCFDFIIKNSDQKVLFKWTSVAVFRLFWAKCLSRCSLFFSVLTCFLAESYWIGHSKFLLPSSNLLATVLILAWVYTYSVFSLKLCRCKVIKLNLRERWFNKFSI